MLEIDLANREVWNEYPQISEWIAASRLSPLKLNRENLERDAEAAEHIGRYLSNVRRARERLRELLPA